MGRLLPRSAKLLTTPESLAVESSAWNDSDQRDAGIGASKMEGVRLSGNQSEIVD